MTNIFAGRRESSDDVAQERRELLLFCGLLGLVGNLAPLAAMAVATAVAEHSFVADTVSDLARGPHKWIMDTGFYLHAAALLALAIAAAHAHLGQMGWSLGLFCLAGLALVVVLLGLWDAFGNDPSDMSVHTSLTFLLGPLYLAGPLLMSAGAARVARGYRISFWLSAVVWTVFAVAFRLAPTGYDGLLEKIAVAGTLLWTLPLSWLVLARGLGRFRRHGL